MKRVYTADNRALAWHVRNLLESNSIEAEVCNDTLHSAQGGLPVNECNPEVWILNDAEESAANAIIQQQVNSNPPAETEWRCDSCGETNYGQFEICWKCQSEAP